jgi:hypothetical protein
MKYTLLFDILRWKTTYSLVTETIKISQRFDKCTCPDNIYSQMAVQATQNITYPLPELLRKISMIFVDNILLAHPLACCLLIISIAANKKCPQEWILSWWVWGKMLPISDGPREQNFVSNKADNVPNCYVTSQRTSDPNLVIEHPIPTNDSCK